MALHQSNSQGGIRDLAELWSRKLPLTGGGYGEQLSHDWKETCGPGETSMERTSLVQARLAYTFLHGNLEAGPGALARFNRIFWREEEGGWIRSADPGGGALDATIDAYDQAFGLLALAWDRDKAGKVRPEARRQALRALEGLESSRDRRSGGWAEYRNGNHPSRMVSYPDVRRQNPHMHLLEAFLAWMAVDPDGPWQGLAREMVVLLRDRFMTAEGYLREFFSGDWQTAPGPAGAELEGGHHFEWVWLLQRWETLSGDSSFSSLADALYGFGTKRCLDADGLAWDSVDPTGKVLRNTKLLWPQTELLKAHLAMFRRSGSPRFLLAAQTVGDSIRKRYLGIDGTPFFNRLDGAGKPLQAPAPVRVLYHLFVAFMDLEETCGRY